MREVHPDVSNDDEDTTEFAVFLNDVYETLSDPERRAAYDEIAGIAATGVNPFADSSYEADKVCIIIIVSYCNCSTTATEQVVCGKNTQPLARIYIGTKRHRCLWTSTRALVAVIAPVLLQKHLQLKKNLAGHVSWHRCACAVMMGGWVVGVCGACIQHAFPNPHPLLPGCGCR